MTKSTEKLRDSLWLLEKERKRLLGQLIKEHKLAQGSVSEVYRKCGSPRCHCVSGPGHRQVLFLFKDENEQRRRCKLVRRADEKRLLRAGDDYRRFRADLQRLRAIEQEEIRIVLAILAARSISYE
jgi:hypothetical protein